MNFFLNFKFYCFYEFENFNSGVNSAIIQFQYNNIKLYNICRKIKIANS